MLTPQTQSFDRNFLNTIKNSFFTSVDRFLDALPFFLWMLGGLAFLVMAIVLYNFIRRRMRGKVAPVGMITDPQKVRALLDEAITARSRVDMKFLPAEPSRRSSACSIIDIHDDTIDLEPPSYITVTPEWMGRKVECFFRLFTPKGQPVFYTFQSSILGVTQGGKEINQLAIATPNQLQLQQKRAFLRLDPPPQYLLGLAVWNDSWEEQGTPPENIKEWGRPPLVYVPDKSQNPVTISNISASGLRITVLHEAVKTARLSTQLSSRLLLLLDLYTPEQERKQRFWLKCRVQNIHEVFETRDVEIGLHIIGVGRPKLDEIPYELVWAELGEDGVEALAIWVMRRHMEMYREMEKEE